MDSKRCKRYARAYDEAHAYESLLLVQPDAVIINCGF